MLCHRAASMKPRLTISVLSRAAAFTGLALVCVAGCQGTVIKTSTGASGRIEDSRIEVAPGVTLTATADLELHATGDIVVGGDMGGVTGTSITLISDSGDITINGEIEAGQG